MKQLKSEALAADRQRAAPTCEATSVLSHRCSLPSFSRDAWLEFWGAVKVVRQTLITAKQEYFIQRDEPLVAKDAMLNAQHIPADINPFSTVRTTLLLCH
jgi:hypothetical protein